MFPALLPPHFRFLPGLHTSSFLQDPGYLTPIPASPPSQDSSIFTSPPTGSLHRALPAGIANTPAEQLLSFFSKCQHPLPILLLSWAEYFLKMRKYLFFFKKCDPPPLGSDILSSLFAKIQFLLNQMNAYRRQIAVKFILSLPHYL